MAAVPRRALIDVHLVEPSVDIARVEQRTLTRRDRPRPLHKTGGDEKCGVGRRGSRRTGRARGLALVMEDVPHGVPTLFIGQEVLDAFPPYQLVRTAEGWREKLVDLDDQASASSWRRSRRRRRGRSRRISSRRKARTRWKWRPARSRCAAR